MDEATRPRAGSLVTPEWLAANRDVTLFHVSRGGTLSYRWSHIPGAIHFDTNRIERPPLWKLVPDAELERVLLEHGVSRTTPVVLYGKPAMAATRVALALLYAGVEEVKILDGVPEIRMEPRPRQPGCDGTRGMSAIMRTNKAPCT